MQLSSANAATLYQQRPAEHRFKDYEPRGYDDPRGQVYDRRDPRVAQQELYAQPADNSQELQKMKNKILVDLAQKARKLPQSKGFDANMAEYSRIVSEVARSLSTSSLPYRAELVKMLDAHKTTVMRIASESYFLSEKMIFDSLGGGRNVEETPLQMAFRNGMRMSEESINILRNMRPEAKKNLQFDRDYLKILLIQQLSDSHARCGARRQCLAQDEKLMQDFKSMLPASLQFGVIITKYIKDLKDNSARQSILPIILGDIKNEMDSVEADSLLRANPSIADEMMSDEMKWAEITQQEPGADVIYPWIDPAAEEAVQAKQKAEAEKITKEQATKNAALKESKKSVIQKGTDDLKAQAGEKGKDLAKNLIGGLFGGQGSSGAGAAPNPLLKGLFG